MIEQEQVVQEKNDDVVSEEVEQKNKEKDEALTFTQTSIEQFAQTLIERLVFGDTRKKQQMIYNSVVFLVLGLLFSMAPNYIQTTIIWIVNTSGILSLLCWAASLYSIYKAYPGFFTTETLVILFCSPAAVFMYILSNLARPKSMSATQYASNAFTMRVLSYMFLFMTITLFMARLPELINLFVRHKEKIKAFFTAKHTIGLILSILAVGTALFQFIQVVMQIFHL